MYAVITALLHNTAKTSLPCGESKKQKEENRIEWLIPNPLYSGTTGGKDNLNGIQQQSILSFLAMYVYFNWVSYKFSDDQYYGVNFTQFPLKICFN